MSDQLQHGLYRLVVTDGLEQRLDNLSSDLEAVREKLPQDASQLLTNHIATLLKVIMSSLPAREKRARQIELANQLVTLLVEKNHGVDRSDIVERSGQLLSAIYPVATLPGENTKPHQPMIPVSDSTLLVNAHGEPSVGLALQSEIASADRIDLLCAFIKWSGLRLIQPELESYFARGGQLRVITTSYMGASDWRAINWLAEQNGCQVYVSYNNRTTRLHAKSWLFHRDSGFSTGYIGSSNLSSAALLDGVEWNVRLSSVDNAAILGKFKAAFESYWEDNEYEPYYPEQAHQERLKQALMNEGSQTTGVLSHIDVHPYHYQQEILEALDTERRLHDRWRNLVVSATGTGKTVMAAFDYRRLIDYDRFDTNMPSLLFVAHRKEILQQAQGTFWNVLHRADFGELFVGGEVPSTWRHVFASIQSLQSTGVDRFQPDHFDVIIVDEFHHAAARSYQGLLERMQPKLLLGLTATPERHDELSIKHWFDDRFAAELRLWSALEQGLLCPFHYFGIHDGVDLQHVRWSRTGYDSNALTNLYTSNDARVRLVLNQLQEKVVDVQKMIALGFCVSVEHAKFMSLKFNREGIQAAWLDGGSPFAERAQRLNELRDGELQIIFAVDLFNEGLDIPQINTVLFLRPTESATLFMQQLGRGLRQTDEKDVLTVLDFIGNAHQNFRYDLRYRALLGGTRRDYRNQLEGGFAQLPAGSAFQLDRMSRQVLLDNLQASLPDGWRQLKHEVIAWGAGLPLTLENFLTHSGIELGSIYRGQGHCWTTLKIDAGVLSLVHEDDFRRVANGIGRMIQMDDQLQLDFLMVALSADGAPQFFSWPLLQQRRWLMFHFELWGDGQHAKPVQEGIERLWKLKEFRLELIELFRWLRAQRDQLHQPLTGAEQIPLQLHAHYSRRQICAAIGQISEMNPFVHREGVWFDRARQCDYFFVTLQKDERHFTPTTRYNDYAISEDLFHWESQSGIREESPTGQRYIHHQNMNSRVMLFVRETNKEYYQCLGHITYQSHEGERPMAIRWLLNEQIPERSRHRYSLVS